MERLILSGIQTSTNPSRVSSPKLFSEKFFISTQGGAWEQCYSVNKLQFAEK